MGLTEPTLTTAEVASLAGVTSRRVRDQCAAGRIRGAVRVVLGDRRTWLLPRHWRHINPRRWRWAFPRGPSRHWRRVREEARDDG